MEPTLAIIGLNFRTSPVAIRERFCISDSRRSEILRQLVDSEGVDEVMVLSTCDRTEFILWANDVPAAANSVLRLLTHEYQLKLCEWSRFYRLMDDIALTHLFRVVAGLDSMVLAEPEIAVQVKDAWAQALSAGTTARFLDTILQKAMTVGKRLRTSTAVGPSSLSIPFASVELAKEILGELAGREVLLMGAGKMSELAARYLMKAGVSHVKVLNRTFANAEGLAHKIGNGAIPVRYEEHLEHLRTADIVVSSAACPHFVVTRLEAEGIAKVRKHKPVVMIDIAVPRNIEPTVREVKGIHLFDMDDLEQVVKQNTRERQVAAEDAEKIVQAEVQGFRQRLTEEREVPTIVALRQHLEELCRQELDVLRHEFGPFTEDQDRAFTALTTHLTQRIAGALSRELKELPGGNEQHIPAPSVTRLLHLEQPDMAAAGAKN